MSLALHRSNLGLAMGGGSQEALDAADATLVNDNLGALVAAIRVGRNTCARLRRILVVTLPIHLALGLLVLLAFGLGANAQTWSLETWVGLLAVNFTSCLVLGLTLAWKASRKSALSAHSIPSAA